ncbi:hypothetical protein MNBD_BACTEROID05-984 [hydrothermal vent metagenome]|uniref:Uncharacterized protein n=1 Tax=hydrothermal vent metagenome TaxID=652676 RepID=A0A3B0T7V6_9ZZZZ
MKKTLPTTIEITDTHIKLLQAKTVRKKAVLFNCQIRPLNQFTDDEIVKVLTDVALAKNVSPDSLTIVIPRRLVIVKQMKLPSLEKSEIKKMIGLQLVSQIPYPVDEVIYDYTILEKETSGYTRVLISVVHKEITDRYLRIFKRIGISFHRLTISSVGLLGWWNYQHGQAKAASGTSVTIVNIDTNHTEVCFLNQQKILYARSINYGSKDLSEENMLSLVEQIEMSLSVYQKDAMGPQVTRMVILSSMPQANLLRDKCEEQFKCAVSVMSSLDHVMCQKKIDVSSLKNEAGISLACGLGLLLSHLPHAINLTPREVHATKKSSARKKKIVRFVFLFMLTIGLAGAVLGKNYFKKVSELSEITSQVENIEGKVSRAKQKTEFIDQFQKEFSKRISVADFIFELNGLTPQDISFRSVQFNGKGFLTIQGYAENRSSINNFQGKLVKSSMFHNVSLEFATKRKIFNMEVTGFKIICSLRLKEEGQL